MNEPNSPERVEASAAAQKPEGNSLQAFKVPPVKVTELTRSELVAALDSEIERIEEENKRPGWSNWALQGGIATFFWLALADFGPKSNLQTIGVVFLFGSFLSEFLLLVCKYPSGASNPEKKQLRYRFSSDDPNTTPAMIIFTLVRFSGLLVIYSLLDSAFRVPTLIWYCGITIALCIVALPFRLMKLLSLNTGLSIKNQRTFTHSFTWLCMAWSGFISYQLLEKLPFSDADYRVADFRVGFLLVGVVYLFWLLTTGEKERPIVNTLKGIRRELAFGRMSVEEAAKDADTALSDLTATAAIEHKLIEISVELQNAIFSCEKLMAECRAADLALKRVEAHADHHDSKWREDARKVAKLIDSCETKRVANQRLVNAAYFKIKGFLHTFENLNTAVPVSKSELASKWQDMRKKMGNMFELANSSVPLLDDIKARYTAISLGSNRSGE